MIYWLFSYNY